MFRFLFPVLVGLCLLSGCQNGSVYIDDDEAMSERLRAMNADRIAPTQQAHLSQGTYRYDNQKLSHEVLSALLSQDTLRTAHLQVAGYHGDLLILGEVPDEDSVLLAQNIAASFDRVKHIRTDLVVGKNLATEQRAQDSLANTQVKAAIAQTGVPHAHLHIITNNKKVYIVGPVSTKDKAVLERELLLLSHIQQVYFYY